MCGNGEGGFLNLNLLSIQDVDSETLESFKPFITALSQTGYMEHRDRDVRLRVALCLSDVLRIYAGLEPPFSQHQLSVGSTLN